MSRATHYRCDVVHLDRHGEPSTKRHLATCKTAEGHSGSTSTCGKCNSEYVSKFWTPEQRDRARERRGVKGRNLNHYACDLPEAAHPILRGVGRGHRAGCVVAPGHKEGASASNKCRACARTNQRKIMRKVSLKNRHKMTLDEYQVMFDRQGGKCAICGRGPDEKSLAVDHDHQTGVKRGLLCYKCNLGLGNFLDNVESLKAAIRYLQKT